LVKPSNFDLMVENWVRKVDSEGPWQFHCGQQQDDDKRHVSRCTLIVHVPAATNE